MGEHDVAYVPGVQTQSLDPPDRGLVWAQRRPQGVPQQPQASSRVADVLESDPGIHQHQGSRRLDEQDARGRQARHRAAVELVDPHGRDGTARR